MDLVAKKGRNMNKMTANMYVISNLSFVSPEQTVFDAYAQMQKRQVHHLPVISDGKAVGIISDRDLLFINQFGNSKEILCKDIMTSSPYVVSTGMPIATLAKTMVDKKINSALINNNDGKIVGIFTSTDALKILSTHLEIEEN